VHNYATNEMCSADYIAQPKCRKSNKVPVAFRFMDKTFNSIA